MEPVMDRDDRPTAFSVRQFCEMHAIGRTTFYEEVKYGRLRIRKLDRQQRTISGTFEGHLYSRTDSLAVTDGRFDLRY